jgi:hypothetical protein
MPMRSANAPRRLYKRSVKNGGPLVLVIASVYYAPRKGEKSAFSADREVTTSELKPSGGKRRLEVSQAALDGGAPIVETWVERDLVFKPRAPKAAAPVAQEPEASPAG